MSTPTRSQLLNVAIDQIYSTLPSLFGANYKAFEAELRRLLRSGSDKELLDLFYHYPAAYNRLLDEMLLLAVTHNLFGDPIFTTVSTKFRCPNGPHEVEAIDAIRTPPKKEPKCPIHQGTLMTPVGHQP